MKYAIVAAALLLAQAGSALAQEAGAQDAGSGSASADILLPTNGGEGITQTAQSLPENFSSGTTAYAQAQSVARYLAGQERRIAARRPLVAADSRPGSDAHE